MISECSNDLWKGTCNSSESLHSSVGTTGQNIIQCIKCTDRDVWTKVATSEEEDKSATVLYLDINSLNLIQA